jgi:hypothetical protein
MIGTKTPQDQEGTNMGKVIVQASMSLDGFIAGSNDEVGPLFDWYEPQRN